MQAVHEPAHERDLGQEDVYKRQVEYLGIQENPNRTGWAAAKNYGYDLVSMMKAYF